jgi:hypothetical protein
MLANARQDVKDAEQGSSVVTGDDRKRKGWIAISKCLADHPVVGFGVDGEPYSRAEAWIWMLQTAAWKERDVAFNGRVTKLQRGQLVVSERFLALRWNWTAKKVRYFVTLLRAHGMVVLGTTKGRTGSLVTICKYEDYQTELENRGTLRGAPEGQIGAHVLENKVVKQANKKRSEEKDSMSTRSANRVDEPMFSLIADADAANTQSPLALSPDGAPVVSSLVGQDKRDDMAALVAEAVGMWQKLAAEFGLSKVRLPLSPRRVSALKARLKTGGLVEWQSALEEIRKTPQLHGKKPMRSGTLFKADLDFVCQAKSWDRLTEGFYSALNANVAHKTVGQAPAHVVRTTADPKLAAHVDEMARLAREQSKQLAEAQRTRRSRLDDR